MRLCTGSILAAAIPLLTAPTTGFAQDGAQSARAPGSGPISHTAIKSEGGPAGGGSNCPVGDADCTFDNPGPAGTATSSQADNVYPFFSEVADDFMLAGDTANPCRLDCLTVWGTLFNQGPPGTDNSITGFYVTVYENDPNPAASADPLQQPDDAPDGESTGFDINGVVTRSNFVISQFVPIDIITEDAAQSQWDIPLFVFKVEKQQKLWLSVQAELVFTPQWGWAGSSVAPGGADSSAVQIFPLLGTDPWETLDQNQAFFITGAKTPIQPGGGGPCPYDCQPVPEGSVATPDLLELLAQWGGPGSCDNGTDGMTSNGVVDTVDLLALLAAWGDCPSGGFDPPANDECGGAIALVEGDNGIDIKGATPSLPDPSCEGPGGDAFYCYTHVGLDTTITIATTIDVTVEVYDACCPQGAVLACGRGLPLFGGVEVAVAQGSTYGIRLINSVGTDDGPQLKGNLNISAPVLSGCDGAFPLTIGDAPFLNDSTGSAPPPGGEGPPCDGDSAQDSTDPGQWYQVVGNGNELRVSQCVPLANLWQAAVTVYCAPSCDQLTTDPNVPGLYGCVGSESQFPGPCNFSGPGTGLINSVDFCSTDGQTYWILVRSFPGTGEGGPYTIRVTDLGVCVSSETVCEPLGACCLTDGTCVDGVNEIECCELSRFSWNEGLACADVTCETFDPDCDYEAAQGGTFVLFSDINNDLRRFDNFVWGGGDISTVSFEALQFDTNTSTFGCADPDLSVEIGFYPDDGTGLPDILNPHCVEAMIVPSVGPAPSGLNVYGVALSAPCTVPAGMQWISIMGDDPGDACIVAIGESLVGDCQSLIQTVSDETFAGDFDFELNFCINPSLAPPDGACCLNAQGDGTGISCVITDRDTCQSQFGAFFEGATDCNDLFGDGSLLTCVTPDFVTKCSGADAQQFPIVGTILLTDIAAETRRYDNFALSAALTDITSVSFHAAILDWDPDAGLVDNCVQSCDTTNGCVDAGLNSDGDLSWEIGIYADAAGEPGALQGVLNTGEVAVVTPATIVNVGFGFPSGPTQLNQYLVNLSSPVNGLGTGTYWVSIAGDDAEAGPTFCTAWLAQSFTGDGASRIEDTTNPGVLSNSFFDLNFCINPAP